MHTVKKDLIKILSCAIHTVLILTKHLYILSVTQTVQMRTFEVQPYCISVVLYCRKSEALTFIAGIDYLSVVNPGQVLSPFTVLKLQPCADYRFSCDAHFSGTAVTFSLFRSTTFCFAGLGVNTSALPVKTPPFLTDKET